MKMTKRTPFKQAIGLAMRTTLFVTMAASAATAPVAAETNGNPLPTDGFAPIHIDNQKIGSAVSTYWQAQAATSAANAITSGKPTWERQTDSAYRTVFAYYCAPAMLDGLAGTVAPQSIEVAIYTDRLRVEYAGDCRAFYLNEVAARLDPPTRHATRDAHRP
jgi:hypothetical protein